MRKSRILLTGLIAAVVLVGALPAAQARDHDDGSIVLWKGTTKFVENLADGVAEIVSHFGARAGIVDGDDFIISMGMPVPSAEAHDAARRIAAENNLRQPRYMMRLHAELTTPDGAVADSFFDIWIEPEFTREGPALNAVIVPEAIRPPSEGTVIVFTGLELRRGLLPLIVVFLLDWKVNPAY